MKLYTVKQVRAVEKAAIEQQGISEHQLMETAGQAAWECCHALYPQAKRFHLFCGPGNNGGDGYVFASAAATAGCQVVIVLMAAAPALGTAAHAYQQCQVAGIETVILQPDFQLETDVIVDAIFGIGLQRDVGCQFADAIEMMNAHPAPIFALDTPSGVDADTGRILGCATEAAHTVTFIGNKLGFYLAEARACCGEIHVHDLNLPASIWQNITETASLMDWQTAKVQLGPRKHSAHKGDFGHVLIVGGNHGYAGAACMAGLAAARTGAGLVSIVTRPEHASNLVAQHPELMALGIDDPAQCKALLARASVIVIGPGLGQDDWARDLTDLVFATELPLVIDADALHFFADATPLKTTPIITPHPGEAARLLQVENAAIQANRMAALNSLMKQYQAITVLKGANTLVSDGNSIRVCDAGNPGMATGGMGDVLSGVIAGLIAQGLRLYDAASTGVLVHALAGDRAARTHGQRGLMATDLCAHIQDLINE